MSIHLAPAKLRADHLARPALIYVRQSTLAQVRENWGSTARQYDLVQRARDLGWAPEHIRVIDQDQAHSGTTTAGRDGFQDLVAAVGLGQAGAVLSLEVSRLARNNSDWYRLIEICALTDTLVIDEDGVYDPGTNSCRGRSLCRTRSACATTGNARGRPGVACSTARPRNDAPRPTSAAPATATVTRGSARA